MGFLRVLKKIETILKTNIKWIGFFIVTIFTFYSMVMVVLSDNSVINYALGFVYLIGIVLSYFYVKKEKFTDLKFFDLNIIFVITGTILTYEISNLGVNIVVSSALLGLFGHFFFKKYSVAVYTGSFAGMSSHMLFNRLEIFLVAILTALAYQIVKNIFNGYGGRMGTIAFISTSLIAMFFNKESFPAHFSYNIWLILLFSIVGVLVTWILHNKLKQSHVLSSALPGLIIGFIFGELIPSTLIYSFTFFTATFIGMANNTTIRNVYESLIMALIMCLIFLRFFNLFNGFGGKMGFMAFSSIIIGKVLITIYDISKNKILSYKNNRL